MYLYHILTGIANDIFIRGLCISILFVAFAEKLFKVNNYFAFEIIRWIILAYALFNIIGIGLGFVYSSEIIAFSRKADTHYWFAFYIKITSGIIMPLLLVSKKLGRNKYVLLSLSILINISWFFESVVVYAEDAYRVQPYAVSSYNFLWLLVLKGLVVGAVIYIAGKALLLSKRQLDMKHH